MKISFVLPSRSVTGGVRVVYEYANQLTARGHEVTIVSPTVPPHPWRLVRELGLSTTIRKAVVGSSVDWETDATTVTVPALTPRLLRRRLPDGDAVVAPSWRSAGPVAALDDAVGRKFHLVQHYEAWELWNTEACWERAAAIAAETDEPIPVAMADVRTDDLGLTTDKARVDEALQQPLRKIAVSGWLEQLVRTKFDQEVEGTVIHGVDTETFLPDRVDGSEDQSMRTVLSPYRDAAWKGSADAIEAFRQVRAQLGGVRFEMFGPIDGGVPEWIQYHGRISDAKLRRLYAGADVFAFPSWVEGFGLPPIEAMACGCATVSTPVGAVPEFAVPGETVEVAPRRDPNALADRIIELLTDETRREELAAAALDGIQQYSWERATDKLETILQEAD